ncbi:uncharacterized protein LOC135488054 [Lineus longissimus]|uniref:uncharacterized protein LOC135488054 n=1 Tax=Lineus longissimus TaxID=88925 RepID=UPI002B4DC39E
MLKLLLVSSLLLLTALAAHALTEAEIAKFTHKDGTTSLTTDPTDANVLIVKSNGLPDHDWQRVNPNTPQSQSHSYKVQKNPSLPAVSGTSQCLPMATIGIAINGVPFYSPYTADSLNAGECEKFDSCDGHADDRGSYHYHVGATCVVDGVKDKFLGVAMDGHPVYSAPDGFDKTKLDECHGQRFTDKGVERYRYILSGTKVEDYPYILGCFKGDIIDDRIKNGMKSPQCRKADVIKSKTACKGSVTGVQGTTMLLANVVVFIIALWY